MFNTIRETIRTTRIYASPSLKSEYGPELWADKRKESFGRLRLVNDPSALPVDTFHSELVEMDPSSFTDGLFCLSDMLEEMLDYMRSTSRNDDNAAEFAYRLERMTAERDALREKLERLQTVEDMAKTEPANVHPAAEQLITNDQYAAGVKATAEQLPGVAVTVKGGCYVWIMGETKPHKDTLKAMGCRWSPKKSAWYWSPSCKRVSA